MESLYIQSITRAHEAILKRYTGVPMEDKPEGWQRYRKRIARGADVYDGTPAAIYAAKHAMASNLIDNCARAYRAGGMTPAKEKRTREVLIAWHGPLATSIVCKYAYQGDPDDLMSVALEAVGNALDKFDPAKYQWGWGSRGYISSSVERALWKALREEQKHTDKRSETIEEDEETLVETLGTEAPKIPEDLNFLEISGLSKKEAKVLKSVYGLGGKKEKTRSALGKEMGVSRELVRQITNKALQKIKAALKADRGCKEWSPEAIEALQKIETQMELF